MPRRIALSGDDWQFKAYYGEDWRWRNAHQPNTRDNRLWYRGTVPGSVCHDLWALGEIPNPYFERNSLLIEWIPARTWVYKKTFFAETALQGKRVRLHFEGIDYEAQIFLNGEWLGDHRGMYTPAVFEVSERLRWGEENLLAVVIQPAPFEQPQVGRTSLVQTHKSRMTYWWDFCPRMIHVGIWDDVYLEVTAQVRINDVFVRPQLTPDFRRADVSVAVELDSAQQQTVQIELGLRLAGETVASAQMRHSLTPGQTSLTIDLLVEQPRLWYPNGCGEQPIYQADVSVWAVGSGHEAAPLDQTTVDFGIRKVELAQNETSDPSARAYTFVVNGRKIYVKGWNWVPMDVLYGVPRPEKLERLLSLAQRAHVNLLRIWGGGLIEKTDFYEQCDRRGIMVWQEFIQSSSGIDNSPPQTPDFIEMLTREAEQIIPRRRNHPSLVLWCGGNELTSESAQPLDDHHPALAALKLVVARLDPDRLWLPTSPTGRVFLNSLDNIERDPSALHDVHGPWEYQGAQEHYRLYNQGSSLLHSEFGVEGITNFKTLNATIAPENQYPPTLDNVFWQHLGAWWVHQPAWQAAFGEIASLEMLVKATQYLQAEGLRYAVEANRRRKYHNSGTLPWQFNEPYPMAACTSAVDYYGQPKPVYYAVAHAYESVHISAKFAAAALENADDFSAEIWLNNSHETALSTIHVEAQIVATNGDSLQQWAQRFTVEGNSAAPLLTVGFPLRELETDVFFLDLRCVDADDQVLSRNRYALTRAANFAPLLSLPAAELAVQTECSGDQWTLRITNTGDYTALRVWLEDSRSVGAAGYACFDVNYFCLFPQETQSVRVDWQHVPPAERALDLTGWNVSGEKAVCTTH